MAKPPTRSKYPPGTRIRVLRPVSAKMMKGVLVEQHQTVYRGPERSGGNPKHTGGEKERERRNGGLRQLESRDRDRVFPGYVIDRAHEIRQKIETAIQHIYKQEKVSRKEAIRIFLGRYPDDVTQDRDKKFRGVPVAEGMKGDVHFKIIYNPYTRSLSWASTRRIFVEGESAHRDGDHESSSRNN